ncbi:thiamine phosphate synthase [Longimicrobium terrae]|nr:thiamine phosphate synthase [Longimicrobium terrae]
MPFRLLAIGGRAQATPAAVRRLLESASSAAVLLREPGISPADLVVWAEEILPLCRAAGALLLVHADAEAARVSGADGVHLPERGDVAAARAILGPAALIGASRHDAAGIHAAAAAGADYATFSPIFPVDGKGPPLGLAVLAEVCAAAPIPVVALGGVTPALAPACLRAGACAVAAIRAAWGGGC